MEFKKKLKTRLYVAIAFIVLGIIMITSTFIVKTDNHFVSSYGLALVVMGIARLKKHFIITKDDATIKKQEIRESDERNVSIQQKAKSAAFMVYLLLSCVVVIVLSFLALHEIARWISLSVCLLIVLYWIFYLVYQKIS